MKQIELQQFVARKKRMTSKEFTKITDKIFGKNDIMQTATYLGVTWRQIYNYKKGVTDIPNPVALCLFQKNIIDQIPQSWIGKIDG